MKFPRTLPLLVTPALLLAGCSSSSPGPSGKPTTFAAATQAQVEASSAAWSAQAAVVDVASSHFTTDLTTTLPPLTVSGPQADALGQAFASQGAWLNAAAALGGVAVATTSSPLQASPSTPGSVRSAIIGIDDAIIIAGIAVAAWAATKGVSKAITMRTAPVATKIDAATPAEVKVINQALGLPATTTQQEAKAAFEGLGMGSRLIKAKDIEQKLRVAETVNAPNVNSVPAELIQKAVADSTVQCGKVALTTTVGVQQFNGQGYVQVGKALGASETTAAAVDLTITAVSTATDVPLQPLDKLADRLDATVASKQTTTVTVTPPATVMTPAHAAEILASPDPTIDDWDDAADTQALSTIQALPSGAGFQAQGDGSLTGAVPQQIHQLSVDKPTNTEQVEVRDIGPATVLVSAPCREPATFDVDTTTSSQVSYDVTADTCHTPTGNCSTVWGFVTQFCKAADTSACKKCVQASCAGECTACDVDCWTAAENCSADCLSASVDCQVACLSSEDPKCDQSCSDTEGWCLDNCPNGAQTSAMRACVPGACESECSGG